MSTYLQGITWLLSQVQQLAVTAMAADPPKLDSYNDESWSRSPVQWLPVKTLRLRQRKIRNHPCFSQRQVER